MKSNKAFQFCGGTMPSLKCFNTKSEAIDFATRNPYKWSGCFVLRNRERYIPAGAEYIVVRRESLRTAMLEFDVTIEMEID